MVSGTFEPRKRAARTGRNPQTGKELKIPAKTVPAFSAGKNSKLLLTENSSLTIEYNFRDSGFCQGLVFIY